MPDGCWGTFAGPGFPRWGHPQVTENTRGRVGITRRCVNSTRRCGGITRRRVHVRVRGRAGEQCTVQSHTSASLRANLHGGRTYGASALRPGGVGPLSDYSGLGRAVWWAVGPIGRAGAAQRAHHIVRSLRTARRAGLCGRGTVGGEWAVAWQPERAGNNPEVADAGQRRCAACGRGCPPETSCSVIDLLCSSARERGWSCEGDELAKLQKEGDVPRAAAVAGARAGPLPRALACIDVRRFGGRGVCAVAAPGEGDGVFCLTYAAGERLRRCWEAATSGLLKCCLLIVH